MNLVEAKPTDGCSCSISPFFSLLQELGRQWSVRGQVPYRSQPGHLVTSVCGENEQHYVVKIFGDRPAYCRERDALRRFAGQGAAALIDADDKRGALLLEQLRPGMALSSLGDDQHETRIAAELMRELWKSAPEEHQFHTLSEIGQALDQYDEHFSAGGGPIPKDLMSTAKKLLNELLSTQETSLLLHGDLHQGNILSAQRRPWLIIDPHGVVGEPAYEVGQFLLNPSPQPEDVLRQRLKTFASVLEIDVERLWAWGVVKAVIAACWMIEDKHPEWDQFLTVGLTLAALSTL